MKLTDAGLAALRGPRLLGTVQQLEPLDDVSTRCDGARVAQRGGRSHDFRHSVRDDAVRAHGRSEGHRRNADARAIQPHDGQYTSRGGRAAAEARRRRVQSQP